MLCITQKTYENQAQSWLRLIRFNECGLIINFVGDHFYNIPYLFNDKKTKKKFLGKYYNKYIFIYYELTKNSDENSLVHKLIKETKKRLIKIPNCSFSLQEFIDYLVEQGYEIAFFLSRVEDHFIKQQEIFFRLEQISRESRVSFLYFSEINLTNQKFEKQQRKLASLFQNVIYQKIYSVKDVKYFIAFNERLWKIPLPNYLKEKILELCGGDFWLIRHIIRDYRNNPNNNIDLFDRKDFIHKATLVWNHLLPNEQKTVIYAIEKHNIDDVMLYKYLLEINFLKKIDENKVELSIPILRKVIQQKKTLQKIRLVDDNIYFGDKNLATDLSPSENRLLKHFLKNNNKLLTRDELAKVIWKKELPDYSDWAFDIHISRLRKKLHTFGFPKNFLMTKKGRGYVSTI